MKKIEKMASGALQKRKTSLQNILGRNDEEPLVGGTVNAFLFLCQCMAGASVSNGLCLLCHRFKILNAI